MYEVFDPKSGETFCHVETEEKARQICYNKKWLDYLPANDPDYISVGAKKIGRTEAEFFGKTLSR